MGKTVPRSILRIIDSGASLMITPIMGSSRMSGVDNTDRFSYIVIPNISKQYIPDSASNWAKKYMESQERRENARIKVE